MACLLLHTRRIVSCSSGNIRMRLVFFICGLCLLLSSYQYAITITSSSSSTSYKPLLVLGLRVLEGSERKPGEDSESKLLLLQPELALNNSSEPHISVPIRKLKVRTLGNEPPKSDRLVQNISVETIEETNNNSSPQSNNSQAKARANRTLDDSVIIAPQLNGSARLETATLDTEQSKTNLATLKSASSNASRSSSETLLSNSSIAITHNNPRSECKEIPSGLLGKLAINKKVVEMERIVQKNTAIQAGGKYSPENCISRHKVAIIVPYRNRPDQLKVFLGHIHPFLQRQEVEYGIYIVNQVGITPFNRASLLNIGFVEANKEKDWGCAIFHDVDLLPEDDRNLYTCPEQPRHMSVSVDKFKYKLPYKSIFGGVTAVSTEHFRKLNGYSNEFWGWGGEDDDMSRRIRYHRLKIIRYKADIARYTMLKHKQEQANKQRMRVLKLGSRRYRTDGLTNLKYKLVNKIAEPLYTNISVRLAPHDTKQSRRSRS